MGKLEIKMIKNIFIISLIFSYITYGELKLPSIFSDGMILQRNKELIIWGKAEPLSKVQLFFNEQTFETKSDNDGDFNIVLKKMMASSIPLEMKIISNEKTIFEKYLSRRSLVMLRTIKYAVASNEKL